MSDFSTTDIIPDLINKNKTLTINCKHNNDLLNIYIGNKSTDKISLGSNILSAAYIGNTPIKYTSNYTHSCYLYANKIYDETTKSYINPENQSFTIASNLFGRNVGGALALIHTASHNYSGFVILEADENNKLPKITCRQYIDCQTLNYKNKLYLKIGPNLITNIPEGSSDNYQSYKLKVTEMNITYNIYSTWCYVNFSDGGNMQSPSIIGFYYKLPESQHSTSIKNPTTKNLIMSGVVTGCHDYISSGSEGTSFRLVILENQKYATIHFDDTPLSTETFSLGVNKSPTNSSMASTFPNPFKYSDSITISNM